VCYSGAQLLRHCQPTDPRGPTVERSREFVREIRRLRARYRSERRKAGLDSADKERDAAVSECEGLLFQIARTPSTTIDGLAIKIRVLKKDLEDGRTDTCKAMARGALADARRLAKAPSA
jgi:hypothetical protein